MAKFLLVGDVHATVDELDDCEALVGLIELELKANSYDYLVFMGDQTHNHAILNVHVLDFWKRSFLRLRPLVKYIVCLVGNHDLPGNTGSTSTNSMSTLDNLCLVIDDHMVLDDVLFVGFKHKNQDFIDICNKYSDMPEVLCHQTFNGATYENGFPALDGIDVTLLPKQQRYISGHIHSPQNFGPVVYIGAPRWRTLTDAKVLNRALWKLDPGPNKVSLDHAIDTAKACRRKIQIDITPDGPQHYPWTKPKDIVYANFIGPQKWFDSVKNRWNASTVVFKFTCTDAKPVAVKESEGIDQSLIKYLDSTNTTTPKEELKKLIEERIWKTN